MKCTSSNFHLAPTGAGAVPAVACAEAHRTLSFANSISTSITPKSLESTQGQLAEEMKPNQLLTHSFRPVVDVAVAEEVKILGDAAVWSVADVYATEGSLISK